jgi:hypothetical protein
VICEAPTLGQDRELRVHVESQANDRRLASQPATVGDAR